MGEIPSIFVYAYFTSDIPQLLYNFRKLRPSSSVSFTFLRISSSENVYWFWENCALSICFVSAYTTSTSDRWYFST